jgi:uncharacterized protein (TIGR02466 family)
VNDQLQPLHYFPTTVYLAKKLEFLPAVRDVSSQYLTESIQTAGPRMTGSYAHEPAIAEFVSYVSQTAWNILNSQGFAMNTLVTYCSEMWTQEHPQHSYMETHVHPGAQISAFFFLDCPPDGCKIVMHDPRPGKAQANLMEAIPTTVTAASTQIVVTPEPGLLFIAPSWLPHSFTANRSDKPCRFVHINIATAPQPHAEVV